MFRTIAALAFGLASSAACADSMSLAAHYKADGTNPNGSHYAGRVDVDVVSTTTYAIRWVIGGSVYTGFGMRLNDTLAATYMIGDSPGLVIYKVDSSGALDGLWAVRGKNGNGTERLTPTD